MEKLNMVVGRGGGALTSWVLNRVLRKDLDAIIVMTGSRGSCKSGSSISLSYDIDRSHIGKSRFKMKKPKGFRLKKGEVMPRVVFTPTEFLNLISREKLPRGSCIVFDEIGVAGDSREFMSKKNRMLKQVMETIRSRNLVLFLTAPTLASFDASFRRVMSLYVHCRGQSTATVGYPSALVIPRVAQTDPKEGIVYLKSISVVRKGRIRALKKFYVRKPPSFLEAPYKRYKLFMQKKLYNAYSEKMVQEDTYEVKGKVVNHSFRPLVEKVLAQPSKFYDYDKKKFVLPALQDHLELPMTRARGLYDLLTFRLKKGDFPKLYS